MRKRKRRGCSECKGRSGCRPEQWGCLQRRAATGRKVESVLYLQPCPATRATTGWGRSISDPEPPLRTSQPPAEGGGCSTQHQFPGPSDCWATMHKACHLPREPTRSTQPRPGLHPHALCFLHPTSGGEHSRDKCPTFRTHGFTGSPSYGLLSLSRSMSDIPATAPDLGPNPAQDTRGPRFFLLSPAGIKSLQTNWRSIGLLHSPEMP